VVSNAIHATGVGLLLYGSQADRNRTLLTTSGGDTFVDRLRSWFRGEF
jgi:cell division protein FtsA